jgi:acetylornithine deacetylase/succinyl-diaminopimelate desuccinylase-like protein
MATADEEAGGNFGVGWLVKNRPQLFKGVGFVLNEGGGGGETPGQRPQFGIEVTQKVPYWFHLTAHDEPGHGSRPRETSSVTRLVGALERLREHEFEVRIIPAVDAYFKGIAPNAPAKWQRRYANMAAAVRTPGVIQELQRENPGLHTLIRNTCSMTRLGGSDKINVVPAEAWAEIDCRLLPDQDPKAFINELRGVLGPDIEIETLLGFTSAVSSADTRLFSLLREVSQEGAPGATITAGVSGGFTDSHFLRDLGITAYGYSPAVIPLADAGGTHGNNERISVENVRRGVAMMRDIVWRFAVN